MPVHPDATERPASERLVLVCLMLAVLLSPFSVSLVAVSLPTIRAEYQLGVEQVAWLITGYFIPTVVLMPLLGRLGDFLDKRRLYLGGLLVFALGAFLAAFPPNYTCLLLGRVLQGAGWSGLYPLSIAIIANLYPSGRQGTILGIWESAVGLAVIIGPPVGGLLVEFIDWRAIFVLLGLVGCLTLALVWKSVPRFPGTKHPLELDWPGAVTLTLGIVFLLVGLTGGGLLSPGVSASLLAAGTASLFGFVLVELRVAQPFVHLELLRNRVFVLGSLSAALRTIMLVSATVLVPLFLQEVQGLAPTIVGMLLLAYPIAMFPATPIGGRLTDRHGPRWPAMAGLTLMALGMYLLSRLTLVSGSAFVILALAVRGIGAGVCQTPLARAATSSDSRERVGMAAGLYGMMRYGGLALGSAIAGTLLASRLDHHGTSLGNSLASVLAFRDVFWLLALVGLAGVVCSWFIQNGTAEPGPDSMSS